MPFITISINMSQYCNALKPAFV